MPSVLVTLVDADRNWVKAKLGIGDVAEVTREMSASIQTASRRVSSISGSMNEIAPSAELVSTATHKVREASAAMA
jgi:methyl-accepting chemotaxis protein